MTAPATVNSNFCELKQALLALQPTGPHGFEGLVGAALTAITGAPFRLAASGRQDGVDGAATFPQDGIVFEAKLYNGDLRRESVITKIADFARSSNHTDCVWVLGSTTPVSSQLAADVRADAEGHGFLALILDWASDGLPPLAAMLAMGEERVQDFLQQNRPKAEDEALLSKALASLQSINQHTDFNGLANQIRTELNGPSTALKRAVEANRRMLKNVFSDKTLSRENFGQVMTPLAQQDGSILPRQNLTNSINKHFQDQPDGRAAIVHGNEGCGKSWSVVQAWGSQAEPPLSLFCRPERALKMGQERSFQDGLIQLIIEQTGDGNTEIAQKRWKRRIKYASQSTREAPWLVLVIDGLNQRPDPGWGQYIEGFSKALKTIGGKLVVTVRTAYFNASIKPRFIGSYSELCVPEWTNAERDKILWERGLNAELLAQKTAASLKNPRLLNIALNLFDNNNIQGLEELTASHLLFEQMRIAAREQENAPLASKFAEELAGHASEVIFRIARQKHEDLYIFNDEAPAVADGRFFQSLPDDPMRYKLIEDGLTLALGFALLNHLRTAKRDKKNLHESASQYLEPVSSLDQTASVIIAALTIIAVDNDSPDAEFAEPLFLAFSEVQNPDANMHPAFCSLLRARPEEFLDAFEIVKSSEFHAANLDWFKEGIRQESGSPAFWESLEKRIRKWLSQYTLSPEHSFLVQSAKRESAEKGMEAHRKAEEEITNRRGSLSDPERSAVLQQSETDKNPEPLTIAAFELLASRPLVSFAAAFVNWRLAMEVSDYDSHAKIAFYKLVRFNQIDWSETRNALIKNSEWLQESSISKAGQWTLYHILAATGASEDAVQTIELASRLRDSNGSIKGWRLIEEYCETDPCDPNSAWPGNIQNAVNAASETDVSQYAADRSQTREARTFQDVLPALARFKPETAIENVRRLIEDVSMRSGTGLQQGLFSLKDHMALVTEEQAAAFGNLWLGGPQNPVFGVGGDREKVIMRQYCLLMALPLLSAEKQIELIGAAASEDILILDVLDFTKALPADKLAKILKTAVHEKDDGRIEKILDILCCTDSEITEEISEILAEIITSGKQHQRLRAANIAAVRRQRNLLTHFVNSGWSMKESEGFENEKRWGSYTLLIALSCGLIEEVDALNRMDSGFYSAALKHLNKDGFLHIMDIIDRAMGEISGFDTVHPGANISLHNEDETSYKFRMYNADDRDSDDIDLETISVRNSESDKEWEERQERAREAAANFFCRLSQHDLAVLSGDLCGKHMNRMFALDSGRVKNWADKLIAAPTEKWPLLRNFACVLVCTLISEHKDIALKLATKMQGVSPFIRFVSGAAKINHEALQIWGAEDGVDINEVRFKRLDRAADDDETALEVLAALMEGKDGCLKGYVENRINRPEPRHIARALMVAGYSDQSSWADEVLARFDNTLGMLGGIQKTARYAYDRNRWARHWFGEMCCAETQEKFWCAQVLFAKVVDGRFNLWCSSIEGDAKFVNMFERLIDWQVRRRCDEWKKNRRRKLLGEMMGAEPFFNPPSVE